jgi:hypothetical protein
MRRWLVVACLACACSTDTTVGSNFLATPDAVGLPACADGMDNDGDTQTDYPFDPGCTAPSDGDETDPAGPPACSDRADNDADAITDFPLEPGCESAADDDEVDPDPLPECSDGLDNDSDGDTDYPDDETCQSAGGWTETTETS